MKKLPIALAMASCLAFSNVIADDDNNMKTYHVTITNTTANHIITPPIVIAHKKRFKLFHVAQPASAELATMAETGNNMPLIDSLSMDSHVSAIASGTGIHAGESITVTIEAPRRSHFTVAGMLATTNDAFTAVTVKGPRRDRYSHGMAMTYDAGTEENNELCTHIPGPPCNMDIEDGVVVNLNLRAEEYAEGFVTIHNGIHGVGDQEMDPAKLDWRGPTAMVRIHNDG